MRLTGREILYTGLSLAGLIATWYFNLQFMGQGSGVFQLTEFFAAGFANPASSSLTVDVMIAGITFVVWVVPEARRLGMGYVWVYILIAVGIAFACAFPLFLLMRERRMRSGDSHTGLTGTAGGP